MRGLSYLTRDQTRVPRIERLVRNHWATGKSLSFPTCSSEASHPEREISAPCPPRALSSLPCKVIVCQVLVWFFVAVVAFFFLLAFFFVFAVLSLLYSTLDFFSCGVSAHLWHEGSSSLTRGRTRGPLHWALRVLAAGPPGKSPSQVLWPPAPQPLLKLLPFSSLLSLNLWRP